MTVVVFLPLTLLNSSASSSVTGFTVVRYFFSFDAVPRSTSPMALPAHSSVVSDLLAFRFSAVSSLSEQSSVLRDLLLPMFSSVSAFPAHSSVFSFVNFSTPSRLEIPSPVTSMVLTFEASLLEMVPSSFLSNFSST